MTTKTHEHKRLAKLSALADREEKYRAELKVRRENKRRNRRYVDAEKVNRSRRRVDRESIGRERDGLCDKLRELQGEKSKIVEALASISERMRNVQDQIVSLDEGELRQLSLLDEKSLVREPVRMRVKELAA